MNQPVRTPKSPYALIAGGFALGAIAMTGVYSGQFIGHATAAPQTATLHPTFASVTSAEGLNELRVLDNSFKSLAKFVGPAVVDIKATSKREIDSEGRRQPTMGGEGSGFIIRSDGYIVTNDHVVGNAEAVTVTMKDGHEYPGKVIRGNDANSDIAVIKIEAKGLPFLSFADSAQVEPGQFAMAIGAPFGLENTVTVGHISALNRSNQLIGSRVYTDLIQTDTPINMGNSGGPLVDVDGKVIGVNTAIYSPTGGSNGIGFALPSNQVKLITDLLITKGKLTRSMLGVFPQDIKEYERTAPGSLFPKGGALVEKVAGEPAKSAGLQKGDVIIKIGNVDVHSQLDVRNAMLILAPGSSVPVEYIRDGKKKTVTVKLLEWKAPEESQDQKLQGIDPKSFGLDPFKNLPKDFPWEFERKDKKSNDDSSSEKEVPPVGKPKLGVGVADIDAATRTQYSIPKEVQGVVVGTVSDGSVAEKIGVQPGDVIVSFDGQAINSRKQLVDLISKKSWGQSTSIKYLRFDGGSRMQVERTFKLK